MLFVHMPYSFTSSPQPRYNAFNISCAFSWLYIKLKQGALSCSELLIISCLLLFKTCFFMSWMYIPILLDAQIVYPFHVVNLLSNVMVLLYGILSPITSKISSLHLFKRKTKKVMNWKCMMYFPTNSV